MAQRYVEQILCRPHFYRLGLGEPSVSVAATGGGSGDLLDLVMESATTSGKPRDC